MDTQKIEAVDMFSATSKDVIKSRNMKTMLFSLTLLAAGIAMVIISRSMDTTSSMYMFMVTVGILLIVGGFAKLLFGGRKYIFNTTGSMVRDFSIYFDSRELQTLSYLIETGRFTDLDRLKRTENTGVRLDILMSDDSRFTAIQIYEYIPHQYQPVSPVFRYYDNAAADFASFMKRMKALNK